MLLSKLWKNFSLKNYIVVYFEENKQLPCQPSVVKIGITINQKSVVDVIAIQSAITCSKLTIETLEQGVKYVQS